MSFSQDSTQDSTRHAGIFRLEKGLARLPYPFGGFLRVPHQKILHGLLEVRGEASVHSGAPRQQLWLLYQHLARRLVFREHHLEREGQKQP